MLRIAMTLLLLVVILPAHAALKENSVVYESEGVKLNGYIVYDSAIKGPRPGVLVVHEWWGHNDYARERARMLARLGYVALAVDMYGDGKQAAHPEDAQKFSSEIAQNKALGKARFLAAMDVLKGHFATDPQKIGAIGYCFGGAVVLQMARDGVDLDGVVSFHGSLGTDQPAKAGEVTAKVMVAHGGSDPFIPSAQVAAFMDEMNGAGVDYDINVYGQALHSFTNPQADEFGKKFNLPLRYDPVADQASWAAMQSFLEMAFSE